MKTYGQFCALARALDAVGDRWTLLIVRELLVGERSYGELHSALTGVPTNLLADRLRSLEAGGVLVRRSDESDRRRTRYALTRRGRDLEPAVLALIRWGGVLMVSGRGEDAFHPHWLLLALRALLEGPAPFEGSVDVVCDGEVVGTVVTHAGHRSVAAPAPAPSVARAEGDAELLLGLASGHLAIDAAQRAGLQLSGDKGVARHLLTPSAAS